MPVHATVAIVHQVVSIFRWVKNKNASTIQYQKRENTLTALELKGGWKFMTLYVNTTRISPSDLKRARIIFPSLRSSLKRLLACFMSTVTRIHVSSGLRQTS